MPLGAFRQSLNLANPSAPPAGVSYSNWTSSVATDVGVNNSIMGMWPLNDTTMVCATRTGGTLSGSIVNRTGDTLSVGNAGVASTTYSFFGSTETSQAGFIVDQTL